MGSEMIPIGKKVPRHYGIVRSPEELGGVMRAHRKERRLTLEETADVGGTGIRFLSELERGKATAQLGKTLETLRLLGLEVVVVPRGMADRVQQLLDQAAEDERD